MNRPRALRPPPPDAVGRRLARYAAAGRRPFGPLLQALGRADQRILLALRTRGHNELTVRTVQGLGAFGEMGSGWAAIALAGAATRPERRGLFLRAAPAASLAVLANYSLKLTIGRKRPLIDDHPPLARAPSKLSFPSAHSTSSVAGAVVLGRVAPGTRPVLYPLAAAICIGRPFLGMHYPSDVLAGVAFGVFLGRIYPLPNPRPVGPPEASPDEDGGPG